MVKFDTFNIDHCHFWRQTRDRRCCNFYFETAQMNKMMRRTTKAEHWKRWMRTHRIKKIEMKSQPNKCSNHCRATSKTRAPHTRSKIDDNSMKTFRDWSKRRLKLSCHSIWIYQTPENVQCDRKRVLRMHWCEHYRPTQKSKMCKAIIGWNQRNFGSHMPSPHVSYFFVSLLLFLSDETDGTRFICCDIWIVFPPWSKGKSTEIQHRKKKDRQNIIRRKNFGIIFIISCEWARKREYAREWSARNHDDEMNTTDHIATSPHPHFIIMNDYNFVIKTNCHNKNSLICFRCSQFVVFLLCSSIRRTKNAHERQINKQI